VYVANTIVLNVGLNAGWHSEKPESVCEHTN